MMLRIVSTIVTTILVCGSQNPCYGLRDTTGVLNKAIPFDPNASILEETSKQRIYPDFRNQIGETVRVMFHDSRGVYWFGTHSGTYMLDGDSLIRVARLKSKSGGEIVVRAIKEDIAGRIWFGHTGGISYVESDTIVSLDQSDGLVSNDVWCLATDSKGNVWIGTILGASKYDGKTFSNVELPEGIHDSTVGVSSTMFVHDIFEDSNGRIWFGTNAGACVKDDNGLVVLSEKNGVKPGVNKIIETHTGDILISTSNGLCLYESGQISNLTSDKFGESKGTSNATQMANGDIWFNCRRSIFRLVHDKLTEYRISEGDYGAIAYQLYRDRHDRLWLVGWGGAFRLDDGRIVNVRRDGPW